MTKNVEPIIVPDDKILELRRQFLEKLEREGGAVPDGFDQRDIDRVKNRKKWLRNFLEMHDLNMKAALEQLWTTCIWRKKHNVNDTDNEKTVDLDIINAGLMFDRNVDTDGKRLLIFKSKLYTRGSYNVENMKKNLIYYVERLYRELDMEQITILFDMEDTGMSNMDLDYTRYIINLFKLYYPNSLNHILIYELPWVLTATFKIIKGLLPPKAVAALHFVNKKNLKEFISPDQQLRCWGGTDDYTFKFVPQNPNVQILQRDPEDMPGGAGDGNNNIIPQAAHRIMGNGLSKKVHFAPNMSPTMESPMSEREPPMGREEKDKRLKVLDEGIIFGVDAVEGSVTVENVSTETIMFKVKTTNPDKFRVSPPAGIIMPKQLERITVNMVHGHRVEETSARDKFLIMCKPLEEGSDNFVPIEKIHKDFKQASSVDVELHRIRCIYPAANGGTADGSFQSNVASVRATALRNGLDMKFGLDREDHLRSSSNQMMDMHDTVARLERQVNRIQTLQFVLMAIIFLLIALVVVYMPKFSADSLADACSRLSEHPTHTLPERGN